MRADHTDLRLIHGEEGPEKYATGSGEAYNYDGKMKLEGDASLPLLSDTFTKLTQAEAAFWVANPK